MCVCVAVGFVIFVLIFRCLKKNAASFYLSTILGGRREALIYSWFVEGGGCVEATPLPGPAILVFRDIM